MSAGVAAATLLSNGFDMIIGNRSFAWWPLVYWVAPTSVFGALAALGIWRLRADNRAALAAVRDEALVECPADPYQSLQPNSDRLAPNGR